MITLNLKLRLSVMHAWTVSTLMRLTRSWEVSSSGRDAVPSKGAILPEDILFEIATYLSTPDLYNLSITSSTVNLCVCRLLYASVTLSTNQQCITTLTLLERHPEITCHIRKLVIQPNHETWIIPEKQINENEVAVMIERLASHLGNLHSFIWDGLEIPSDSLWCSLRSSCPRLRHIGSSVNEDKIPSESQFFAFNDLLGFSLMVKPRPVRKYGYEHWNGLTTKLPDEMWTMLQNRCPDLRELTIDIPQTCYHKFNPTPLLHCRWPNLRTLLISEVWRLVKTIPPGDLLPLRAFFAAHGNILSLGTVSTQFEEPLELPSLRHLQLTGRFSHVPLFAALRMVSSLTSLSIWIDFRLEWEFVHQVLELLAACSPISHLEILTCLSTPNFKHVSAAIQNLSSLSTLALTMGNFRKHGDMLESAVSLFHNNSSLEYVKLNHANEGRHRITETRFKQKGTYLLSCDKDGRPVELVVHEWGMRTNLFAHGHRFSRHFRHPFQITMEENQE